MAVLQPWADVAEPIHRRLAHLVDAEPGQEVLWVGCGAGRSVLWWAKRFETHVQGIDAESDAIESAERSSREVGLGSLATFQTADPADLPHEDKMFDVTIANLLCLGDVDGEQVVAELGRVARPMSTVAAVVPTWLSTPKPAEAKLLESTGLQPHLLMEWKGFFRHAGIVELAVEDAASDGKWIAAGLVGLLVRGWRAARWAGVRTVLSRRFLTIRRLARRRVLGLSIVKGTRWPHS
jgi:SAM-dependent methyltransferase